MVKEVTETEDKLKMAGTSQTGERADSGEK